MADLATQAAFPELSKVDSDALNRAQRIAMRVRKDFTSAQGSWAVLQNLQRRIDSNQVFREAIGRNLPGGLRETCDALYVNTVLGLMRMTDDPGRSDDRESACNLAGILSNPKLVVVLNDDRWLTRGSQTSNQNILQFERGEQPRRIGWFLSVVPMGWEKSDPRPTPDTLGDMRELLRSLRNEVFAHSLAANGIRVPKPNDITAGLKLAEKIASHAVMIFMGTNVGLGDSFESQVQDLGEVWDGLESSQVQFHTDWIKQMRQT